MRKARFAPAREGRTGIGIWCGGRRAVILAVALVALISLPSVATASSAPHVTADGEPETCAMCHRAHSAPGVVARAQRGSWDATGSALIIARPSDTGDQALCLTCHGIDGFGSRAEVQTDFLRSSVHSMAPDPSDFGPTPKQCSSCHDSHGAERDPSTGLPFARLLRSITSTGTMFYQTEEYCGACHFDSRDAQGSRFDGLAIYEQTPHFASLPEPASGTRISCSICHESHGSDIAPLIRANLNAQVPAVPSTWTVDPSAPRTLCLTCHREARVTFAGNVAGEYDRSLHGASQIAVDVVAEWTGSAETTRLAGECQNCHNPMGADDGTGVVLPKHVAAEGRELCYGCHNAGMESETAGAVEDMASAGVRPYAPGEAGAELVVAWDPRHLPLSYSALHVYTQQRGVVPPRELEGPRRYLSGFRSGEMAYGDIDGLGDTELVVANPAGPELTVLRFDPLSGLGSATYGIAEPAAHLAVGDFVADSNGDREVAVVSVRDGGESVLRVYRFSTTGFSMVAGPEPVGNRASGMAAGNLTNSPTADIVVTSAGDDRLWFVRESSADPGSLDTTSSVTLSAPRGPSVGAGFVAIANSGETQNTLSIFDASGNLDASYEATVTPGGAAAWDTAIGDFLPGGQTAVAVALRSETGANAVAIFPVGATSLMTPPDVIGTGTRSASSSLAVGDLNGDGLDQLAVANAGVLSRTAGTSVSPSLLMLTTSAGGTALEIRNPEGVRWGGGTEMAGGTAALAIVDLGPVGRSRHPASAIPRAHDSAEAGVFQRHAECVDCHNPHTMNNTQPPAPAAYGVIAGTWGVDSAGNLKQGVEYEYELCLKCHRLGWGGTPASRDILAEFSGQSFHPVLQPVGAAQIHCIDCHGNANSLAGEPVGLHVSTSAPLLVSPLIGARPSDTSAQLCYSACHRHNPGVYYSGNPGSGFYNAASGAQLHSQHVRDHGLACQTCHTNHGSPNSFLIRTDVGWVEAAAGGGCFTSCHSDTGEVGNSYSRSVLGELGVGTIQTLGGTLLGFGDLSAVQAIDGSYYSVAEAADPAQPVLQVEVTFSGVTTMPTSFEIFGYYYGPGAQALNLDVMVWDYSANAGAGDYILLGAMPRSLTETSSGTSYPIPAGDFLSAGEMQFLIGRSQNGDPSRTLHLDRVWMRY